MVAMKRIIIGLGCVLIALVLATGAMIGYALTHQHPPESTGTSDLTNYNLEIMLARPEGWARIIDEPIIDEKDMVILDGSTATIPITVELYRQFYGYDDEQVAACRVIHHSTTPLAYTALIDHELRSDAELPVSLILVTPPSWDELNYARRNGVELDMVPIALDGFVFITHRDNPVDSLTVQQIQDIYSGKITNWQELGGNDVEIIAYQRTPNSGSQTAMEQMVMQGIPMQEAPMTQVPEFMSMLVDAVAEYENGSASIGYTYYYYINNLYGNENIKVLRIDGVDPSNEHLISGTYPFATNYYAIIRGDEPTDSPARILRDFLISPEGQKLIELAGYCGVVNRSE